MKILPLLLALMLAAPAASASDCCKPAAPKPDACCSPSENRESSSAQRLSQIESFSKESLYQLDARFTDDSGHAFSLGELRGRPVVLTMFFASCGYACPLLVSDMQEIRAKLPADVRERAVFVLVSFDVARDTPAALATYRAQRQLDSSWILLHGDNDAVRELAALLGVKFKQEANGAFAHSNLITLLNAEGEIAHQRAGLSGGLDETAAKLAQVAR